MPLISTLTVQLELASQNFNAGLKTSQQAVDNFGKTTRQVQASLGLMERGFTTSTANRIAQGWENAAKKAEVFEGAYKKATASAARSTENAAASIQLLTREIGIHLPEGVTKFLSKSSMIGPAMSAAFSGVAVLGLIQVLGQLPALFEKISGAITGWDETAKRAYANFLELNRLAVERLERLRAAEAQALMSTLSGLPLAQAGLAEVDRQLQALNQTIADSEQQIQTLRKMREHFDAFQGIQVTLPPLDTDIRKAEETEKRLAGLYQRRTDLEAQRTAAEADVGKAWFAAATERVEAARRLNEAAAKALLQWKDLEARMSQSLVAQLPGGQFETLLKGGLIVPPSTITGTTAFFDSQFEAIMKRTQEVIDERRTLLIKANEDVANGQMEANRRMLAEMQRATERMLSNIHSAAGAIFDMIFEQGATLGNFLKGIGLTAGRTMFQNLTTSLLAGPASRIPGLAGLFGMTSGAAASLGSTVAAGAAVNASWIPGLAIAAPAIPSIGVAGTAAGGTAGGLGALGALFTNPWTAIIGGGILGGLALSKLFGHRTQEAPFTADPFANRGGQSLTYEFMIGGERASMAGTMTELSQTLDELRAELARLKGIPADAFLTKKIANLYDTDNTFRRISGSKLTGDEL
jgi:hypothetical protein